MTITRFSRNFQHIKRYLILFFFLLAAVSSGIPQQNPFLTDQQENKVPVSRTAAPLKATPFFDTLVEIQKNLRDTIADIFSRIHDGEDRSALFVLMGLSFVYGLVHALGPGHRKVMLFSYFLSKDAKIYEGIAAGTLLSFLHGGMAVIIILIFHALLSRVTLTDVDSAGARMEFYSLTALLLFGLLFFSIKIIEKVRKKQNPGPKKGLRRTAQLGIIIASGSIPCPGAVMILLFSLSLSVLKLGAAAVGMMSLGMAVTLSAVSVVTIVSKKAVFSFAERKERFFTIFHDTIEIIGALCIIIFTLFFLLPYMYNPA